MSRRDRVWEPGNAEFSGPLSLAAILQYHGRVLKPQPWLSLVVGRDARSWGVTIIASEGGVSHELREPGRTLVDSRWMQDLAGLPGVALLAQSALRKVSLDRGWPIP